MVKKLRNKLKNGIIQRFRSKSVKYCLFFLLYITRFAYTFENNWKTNTLYGG